jgi:hypothetical protein
MGKTARITVTSGPDRGKVFQLNEELVHVGSGSENQIALTDQSVAEHQASIVSRDGRYAIYTPLEKAIAVDGNVIPPERWVWLPATAQIVISRRTSFKFDELEGEASAARTLAPGKQNAKPAAGTPREAKAKRPAAPKRQPASGTVARFITDKQGDTLVKLGEDGHLPELHLAEGETRKKTETSAKQTSPVVLYVALALSVGMSLLMLVVDFEPSAVSQEQRGSARQLIVRFYGTDEDNLEPYQELLREARLARSRGDIAAERRAYAQVLSLLNAEDIVQSFSGLTGDRGDPQTLPESDERFLQDFARDNLPRSDQVLRRLISILLRR